VSRQQDDAEHPKKLTYNAFPKEDALPLLTLFPSVQISFASFCSDLSCGPLAKKFGFRTVNTEPWTASAELNVPESEANHLFVANGLRVAGAVPKPKDLNRFAPYRVEYF
jgi:hypothetical protein